MGNVIRDIVKRNVDVEIQLPYCLIKIFLKIFLLPKKATFPLVRRDYYRKIMQGGLYINRGITLRPSSRI